MSKYTISRQFSLGFAAALTPEFRDGSKSEHWLAGWDAGYSLRREKHLLMNKYLIGIGEEPMGEVRLQDANGEDAK